ncbi:MAG: glutamine synthetase [Rhodospirillaceae bacterium]|nr:glutamine synthetase [Rhodospirillaceae bacterium]|tara:strand:- start:28849 stop:30336 length:1488 start_codon:yes stop_codon:yes gene_type:complete
MSGGLIERHSLWSDEQKRCAAELEQQIKADDIKLIRLAWSDSHGSSRAKEVTVPVFLKALTDGYNINVATFTLDATGGRVFRSFIRGGGMGLDEMTGSPNLTIIPDPSTFRTLPWAAGLGWILCDEYFNDGTPFHFSSRQILRNQIGRFAKKNIDLIVGLEVEWYLRRVEQESLTSENSGVPGERGRPIETSSVEPGYSYHLESNFDLMQPVLSELAETYESLGLPLRSIENEYGPGQIECTFEAQPAARAADNFFLFRTVTRQICRRNGYFATFMCKPAIEGYYTNGWHLHQSLADRTNGLNLMMPDSEEEPLSPLATNFLAGLLENANASSVFATPTVNGYRRFMPNSLAPDRATWSHDHRGTMLRVIGGAGDPATRFENRIGEPAANPYLFMASQIVAGLDGIERELQPWDADDAPYEADRPMLPTSLEDALNFLDNSELFREAFGDIFVNYYLGLKHAELNRFKAYVEDNGDEDAENGISHWEQNEYFDFF